MKIVYSNHIKILIVLIAFSLLSCSENASHQEATADGFSIIENDIKNKFGNDAYYTDLTITYSKSIGNMIGVTVTENPESLTMGQWHLTQNNWEQTSKITLEVPVGSNASDFMFQLNDNINLSTLGALIEKSVKQLTSEKNISNPTLNLASIKFPRNGDLSKTEYLVMLQPEHGGTTFRFSYHLNGDLIDFDY